MPRASATGRDAGRGVGRSLDELARSLCSDRLLDAASPESFVEAQISLLLEHLRRQRSLREMLLKEMLSTECALDTLVLPIEGGYRDHDPALKAQVRDRLLALDQERRRLGVEHARRVAEIEVELLRLVSQRLVLQGNGGNGRR